MTEAKAPARRQTAAQIFAIPALLALLSLVGLVSALMGDGARDFLSWLGLAAPVMVTLWALRARRL